MVHSRGTDVERDASTTLFVGNLPYSYKENDVLDLFEKYGKINSAFVPIDRDTGRNKGFSFVNFDQRLDAEEAKDKFTDYELEGRRLRIDWDVGRK